MQSEEALTYNSSGVDIDENQKANRLISEIVGRTLSEGVISQPGFFFWGYPPQKSLTRKPKLFNL